MKTKKLTRKQKKQFYNRGIEFCNSQQDNYTSIIYEIVKNGRKIKFVGNKEKQIGEGKTKKSIGVICFGYDGGLIGMRFI